DGQALDCIAAADAVLTASGTATLETMLVGRPMVVAYRLAPVTYQIARRLVRTPYFALPNLLAGELLVPELLQHAATPAALAQAVEDWFRDPRTVPAAVTQFERLRSQLAGDITAAEVVLEVL
ncbi:MAG: lipid-A-disaccharide synthase, partial [Pseudomonadota bacterium]|nr:lipid-A-disaccharide synthase [Pseudomonadota bacterium]